MGAFQKKEESRYTFREWAHILPPCSTANKTSVGAFQNQCINACLSLSVCILYTTPYKYVSRLAHILWNTPPFLWNTPPFPISGAHFTKMGGTSCEMRPLLSNSTHENALFWTFLPPPWCDTGLILQHASYNIGLFPLWYWALSAEWAVWYWAISAEWAVWYILGSFRRMIRAI